MLLRRIEKLWCTRDKKNGRGSRRPALAPSVSSDDDFDLLAKSKYFDWDWYLSAYQDVDGAASNPIRHYLDWGAAEGRNPNRIFDTQWYQVHNPDVSASGLNPLVHYLRVGSSNGKHPSPTAAAAAALKSKVETSFAEAEKLLGVFSERQEARPGRTDSDNYYENRRKWSEYFMSEGVSAFRKRNTAKALDQFKYAAQTSPESPNPWILYSYVFRLQNSEALELFESNVSDAGLLVTHITCESLLEPARLSMQSFYDNASRVKNLIVIGDLKERSFKFDPSACILRVPSEDSYESLSIKVTRLFLFLGMSRSTQSILKVDNDIHCVDINKLHDDIDNVIANSDYGGRVISLPSPFHDPHIWHFGKCSDPAVNYRADGLLTWGPYVAGSYYWLSSSCVNLLSKVALMHERYFESDRCYEDRAIGNVLKYYGIQPSHQVLTGRSLKEIK